MKYIGKTAFYSYQDKYLFKVVNETWLNESARAQAYAKQNNHTLFSGDGRCDSPGHCAKYSTYSLQNQSTGEILTLNITQVSEVNTNT